MFSSMLFDKDAGHKVFMDDAYEHEARLPGGVWAPAGIPWTDVVRNIVHYIAFLCFPLFFFIALTLLVG